jgi:hypothetical protein
LKLHLHEKVKFLQWLICHNSIPTLSLLHHWNMVVSSLCTRCSCKEETFLHCFRDCLYSKNIWLALGFSSQDLFTETNPISWIKHNLSNTRHNMFVAGLWWSWRNINSYCLSNTTLSIHHLNMEVQNLSTTFNICFPPPNSSTQVDRWVQWNPSNRDCIIINVLE